MNKFLIGALMILGLVGGVYVTSCASTVHKLEEMSDLEYNKWKLYIQLGVKIGANRLLESHQVSVNELNIAATAVETVVNEPVSAGVTSLIGPALEKAGLKNDEIMLVLLIVEQELLARGALEWIDPVTGTIALSPRTKEVLLLTASSLRSAANVTIEDTTKASEMKADFSKGNTITGSDRAE